MATALAVGVGVAAAAFFVCPSSSTHPGFIPFMLREEIARRRNAYDVIGSRGSGRPPTIPRRHQRHGQSFLQGRVREADDEAGGGVDSGDFVRLPFTLPRVTAERLSCVLWTNGHYADGRVLIKGTRRHS